MLKRVILISGVFFFAAHILFAQQDYHFDSALKHIDSLFQGIDSSSFKKAVYEVENAFWADRLSYEEFDNHILLLTFLADRIKDQSSLSEEYKRNYTDLDKIQKGAALFHMLKDTVPILHEGEIIRHLPMIYDFDDIFGDEDWSKMFVIKLLATNKGNCHSLPYLYKILANEMGLEAHLSLAPNHVYIKTHSQQYGWFNVELTSGSFPMDAWLMASSYVTMDAIRSGIYMKALSEQESIALCLVDLARGYANRYPDNDGSFITKCSDLALQHFPDCIDARLIAAEMKKQHLSDKAAELGLADLMDARTHPELKPEFEAMQTAFTEILNLGYRQMPKQMYVNWLLSVEEEKEKYENKKVTRH